MNPNQYRRFYVYRAISHLNLSSIGIELIMVYSSGVKGGVIAIGVFVAAANDFLELIVQVWGRIVRTSFGTLNPCLRSAKGVLFLGMPP